jgi:predicted secreted Zn-dependent protease
MEAVEANVRKMEAELRKWGATLDELKAKADAAGTKAKIGYRRRLDDMQTRYEAAQTKLDELKAAGGGTWETFRGGIETAWNDLRAAFRRLGE